MNIWENTVITAKGIALLSKLVQGNSLTITKAVSGAGYVTPGTLQNQTAISDPKQTLRFRAFSFPAEGKSEVTCYLTNDGLAAGYTAKQIGVYAKDPDEGEILFFITQATSSAGTIVPAEAESPGFSAEWAFTFPYGQADTVSVTVDPSNTVTQAGMEKYVAEATDQFWPSKEEHGTIIAVKDSAKQPFVGLNIYGKSKQVATTGKNLLPNTAVTQTISGVTFTKNDDGSVTAKGTSTVSDPIRYTIGEVELPAGNYYVSGQNAGASSTFLMYSDQGGNFLNQHSGQDAPLTLTESAIISVHLVVFEAASPNVKVYPMIRKAAVADATYEPYTGGAPAPSPEYPQEIVNPGESGSIGVSVYSGNLFDFSTLKATTTQGSFEVLDEGWISVKNTTGNMFLVESETIILPTGCYTINADFEDVNGEPYVIAIHKEKGVTQRTYLKPTSETQTLYVEESCELYLNITTSNQSDIGSFKTRVMVNVGKTPMPYEVCHKQTMTLATPNGLPGVPVTSGGNYTDANGQRWICDEVDLKRGVYVQRVYGEEFDGSDDEIISIDQPGTSTYHYTIRTKHMLKQAIGLCSHYPLVGVYSQNSDEGFCPIANSIVRIRWGEEKTLDGFKAELQSNPVSVLYALVTPIETALTAEEISAYKALTANNPNTTIMNGDGAEMKVQYITKTFEGVMYAVNEMGRYVFDGVGKATSFTFALPVPEEVYSIVVQEVEPDDSVVLNHFGVLSLSSIGYHCISLNKDERFAGHEYYESVLEKAEVYYTNQLTLTFSKERYVRVILRRLT